MNDEDKAALAAWRDYRAARDMSDRAAEGASPSGYAEAEHARKIARALFNQWSAALSVATLKGGR